LANYQLASRKLLHERAKRKSKRHWIEFVGLIAIVLVWYGTLAPSTLGGPLTYAVVSGHSMEPSLYTGDLVVVKKQDKYQIGDTVLTTVMGGYVIHKLVWMSESSFKTQGVNNDTEDTWTLPKSAILGKQVYVWPGLGNFLVLLRTNPLILGVCAAAIGGLLLLDPRRRKVSKRLSDALTKAQKEIPETRKSFISPLLSALFLMTAASMLTTGILLANHTTFYPRLALSLLGLLVSVVAFEFLGNWLIYGKDLEEPYRSLAVFRKRLYRIDSSVVIQGETKPVTEVKDLLTYAEIANCPILHLVENDGNLHLFFVVTDDLNYVYKVDLEHSHKAKHKK